MVERDRAYASDKLHWESQEVAGNHGVAMWGRSEMGFATDPIMVEHNLIFVVTRMQIRMDAYPQWCVDSRTSLLCLF